MANVSFATVIAKASPLTRETFASPFVLVKVNNLMMVGSRASWLAKTVETVIFCVRNSPLTVEPSLSVALAVTTVSFAVTVISFVEVTVASFVAETASAAEMKRAVIRCFIACSL